ncbi:MAG: nucleoside deaminase [Myxococcota bacterium]|nr:nucleoside deaminase [Myxococcota bacterium]
MSKVLQSQVRRVMILAQANIEKKGHGPFAAFIARGSEVIAKGTNRVVATCDPTAHAEVVAIRAAARKLGTHELHGCTLISSCEPCPMCLAAAYWARIEHIVFCASRADACAAGFDDDFIYQQMPLPFSERSIAFTRLLPELAQLPFRAWLDRSDKVPY